MNVDTKKEIASDEPAAGEQEHQVGMALSFAPADDTHCVNIPFPFTVKQEPSDDPVNNGEHVSDEQALLMQDYCLNSAQLQDYCANNQEMGIPFKQEVSQLSLGSMGNQNLPAETVVHSSSQSEMFMKQEPAESTFQYPNGGFYPQVGNLWSTSQFENMAGYVPVNNPILEAQTGANAVFDQGQTPCSKGQSRRPRTPKSGRKKTVSKRKIGTLTQQDIESVSGLLSPQATENLYKCDLCEKTFKGPHLKKSHMRVHFRSTTCSVCNREFRNTYDLKMHQWSHSGEKAYKCEVCHKGFAHEKSLRRHASSCNIEGSEKKVKKTPQKTAKRIPCEKCEKVFRNQYDLNMHQMVHTDAKPFTCFICNKCFNYEYSLKRHFDSQHQTTDGAQSTLTTNPSDPNSSQSEKTFKCASCPKIFKTPYTLKEHEISHSEERPYPCDQCDKGFKRPNALKSHQLRFHSTEKPFECDVCQKRFSVQYALTLHQRTHAKGKRFFCTLCNRSYSWYTSFRVHQKTHLINENSEEKVPFNCDVCGKNFTRLTTLSMHMNIHTKEREEFVCQTCGKSFKWKISLKVHEQSHAGLLPYTCKICNKGFLRAYYMRLHQRIHTGETPYVCETCGRGFRGLDHLKKHQLVHSGKKQYHYCTCCNKRFVDLYGLKRHQSKRNSTLVNGEIQNCICEICNKDFCTLKDLRMHEKSHRGNSCKTCSKTFKKRSDLIRHELIHTGVRPFKCEVCGKGFIKKSALRRHEWLHTGEKPFSCSTCKKDFFKLKDLKNHERIHKANPDDNLGKSESGNITVTDAEVLLDSVITENCPIEDIINQ